MMSLNDYFVQTMLSLSRWSRQAGRRSVVRMEAAANDHRVLSFAKTKKSREQKTSEEKAVEILIDLGISITVAIVGTLFIRHYSGQLLQQQNDTEQRSSSAVKADLRKGKNQLLRERAAQNKIDVRHLSSYELQVADGIINPDDIDCCFADMGGLDDLKQKVWATALAPLYCPELYAHSKLRSTPRGILFYGQPGTGKTMMVKCMAKEAKMILIPLKGSTLLNKYWGESNKIVAAAFALAQKLQPAVLFIDELDNFLPRTGSGGADTALMDSIKAEFLTLWEGIATNEDSKVLVVGATNRPERIDTAILRRMPQAIQLPLPDEPSRLDILTKILADEPCDASVADALPRIATATPHYSGSDLQEVCKYAANIPVQEITQELARRRVNGEDIGDLMQNNDAHADDAQKIRPLHARDLFMGLQAIRPTGEAAARYGKEQQAGTVHLDEKMLLPLLRTLVQGLHNGRGNNGGNDDDDVPTM